MLGLPAAWKSLAFPYQLCIGTFLAFAVCVSGKQRAGEKGSHPGEGRDP